MKTTITKCICDYCSQEMSEFEYEKAVRVAIRVDLPNPNGGCGECGGIEMKLCKQCSEDMGIVNSEEYHKYIDSQNRLTRLIRDCKEKILKKIYKQN